MYVMNIILALKYSPFLQDGATISNGVHLTKALKRQKLGKTVKQVNDLFSITLFQAMEGWGTAMDSSLEHTHARTKWYSESHWSGYLASEKTCKVIQKRWLLTERVKICTRWLIIV